MDIVARKPNLESLNAEGIPQDFEASMALFNRLLDQGKLPHTPRKTPITVGEVRSLWMPASNRNITYISENTEGELVASGTLLVVADSNDYSREAKRGVEYALTFDPLFPEAALEATRKTIEEAKQRGLEFITHISVDNDVEIEMMKELGHFPTRTIERYERYAEAGLNPRVHEYIIS
jgi:hypothetical protein